MRGEGNGRNEARGGIPWLVPVAVAALALSAFSPLDTGAGGQDPKLKNSLFWQASEVPAGWKLVSDDTPFWPWAGEGSVRNGLPTLGWWWHLFMGQQLPPDQILPKSEGYEISHPRLTEYRQALSGVSWMAGPLFVGGPGGDETYRERFFVMEFQTIEGAGDFVAIVRQLYAESAPGRAEEKKKGTDGLEFGLQHWRRDVGKPQEFPGCGMGCGQIRQSAAVSGGWWGWEQRPVALGDEGELFLSAYTHSIHEVLASCRNRRWATVNRVNHVGDYPCLRDGWGLVRRNHFVLACRFQVGPGYDRSWDHRKSCADVFIPPKAPPTAALHELIVRACERMALGAGMPPNIPKEPFGPAEGAAGPLAAALGAPCAQDRAFVESLYRSILEREPDSAGVEAQVQKLSQGTSRKDLIRSCFASPEYDARSRAPREKVRDACQAVLGREPSEAELAVWAQRLESGTKPGTLLDSLFASEEYATIFRGCQGSSP